tara:strand:- start:296 stop:541 length:246 start_codon:yes stop_codon:yes gene_type:complete
MSNKHEMKLMDQEITDLRNQVFYLNTILNNVTEWLEGEIHHNNPVLCGEEKLSDGTDDIHEGRVECAESLLEQIKKWEGEE